MSLKEELAALKARAESKRPPEVIALMHRAVDDLRQSGAVERVARVGQPAPEFMLPNAEDQPISSRDLLARGPLVVTFYRGGW